MNPAWALVDGELVPSAEARVSAFDRTLLYGLGAFETLRLFEGRPYLLDEHLERMRRSLAAVGLDAPARLDELARTLPELAARNASDDCLARITVTAGEGTPGGAPGHLIVGLRASPPPRGTRRLRLGTVDFAHDARSPLAGVKSTSYLVHYLLREAAEAEGRLDDLMIGADGTVTEATVANVFLVFDGALVTPAMSSAILAGVTRQRVLELAGEAGLRTEERRVRRDELAGADEVFLTGSGKGLVDVDELDGRALPSERPVARALGAALARDVERVCGLAAGRVRF